MAKIIDVRSKEWKQGNYEIVLGDNGKWYQYYAFKNEETGEEAYQVAEYFFDSQYVSKEDAENIIGKGKIFA